MPKRRRASRLWDVIVTITVDAPDEDAAREHVYADLYSIYGDKAMWIDSAEEVTEETGGVLGPPQSGWESEPS